MNGNLTTKSYVGNYTYPAQGLNAARPHAPVSVGTAAMAYDDNGNLTSGQPELRALPG